MPITMKHTVAALAFAAAALGAAAPASASGSIGVAIGAPIGNGGSDDGYRGGFSHNGYAPAYRQAYVAPAMPFALQEPIPYLQPGYVWNPGRWGWTGAEWRWTPGYAAYVGAPGYSAPIYSAYGYAAPATVFIGSGHHFGPIHRHHHRRDVYYVDGRRHWR